MIAEDLRSSSYHEFCKPKLAELLQYLRLDQRYVKAVDCSLFTEDGREVAAEASSRIVDGLLVAVGYRQIVDTAGPYASIAADDYLSLRLGGYF